MKLFQNTSGNHLSLTTTEAFKFIRDLVQAVCDADEMTNGGGFIDPIILHRSRTLPGPQEDSPSTLHVHVQKQHIAIPPRVEDTPLNYDRESFKPIKNLTQQERTELRSLKHAGEIIEAIKRCRQLTNASLLEAKRFVEKL